jgi:hypothetical protein
LAINGTEEFLIAQRLRVFALERLVGAKLEAKTKAGGE